MIRTPLLAIARLPSRQLMRNLATTAVRLNASMAIAPAPRTPESVPSVCADPQVAAVTKQAPNRDDVWTRDQIARSQAMTGPRFEQTDFELQPRPYAAIEFIHKQPVRWTQTRIVACDGGGGPNGHPRVFINTDKPEIAACSYCGMPYANEHHREYLESLPATSYPL